MLKIIFFKDKREISRLLIQLCAVVTGVIVFLLTLTAAAYLEAAPVYQDTLRLHIRAASDSEEDQALKLLVRDRLTGLTAELTEGAEMQNRRQRWFLPTLHGSAGRRKWC